MSEVTFKPYQQVLVRDTDKDKWRTNWYSHLEKDESACVHVCVGHKWIQCIPYNGETKHLLGTTDKPQHPDGSFKEKHFTNCRHSDWYGETMEEELKPFQPVLVRDFNHNVWHINFFERKCGDYFQCLSGHWKQCLPYNDETAHLIGTTDSPTPPEPEFRFGDKVEVRNDNGQWHKAVYFKTYAKDEARDRFCVMVEEGMLCYKYCRHAAW